MSHKLACWSGAQGQVTLAKNVKTYLNYVIHKKNKIPNLSLKKIETQLSRYLEGLDSSLALVAGELWPEMWQSTSWQVWALRSWSFTSGLVHCYVFMFFLSYHKTISETVHCAGHLEKVSCALDPRFTSFFFVKQL